MTRTCAPQMTSAKTRIRRDVFMGTAVGQIGQSLHPTWPRWRKFTWGRFDDLSAPSRPGAQGLGAKMNGSEIWTAPDLRNDLGCCSVGRRNSFSGRNRPLTSMIGLCQEGKSSPDALRRSAGVNPSDSSPRALASRPVVPIPDRTRLPFAVSDHLHHLAHQQVAIPQRPSPFTNRSRCHVALGQEIAAQAVANLAGIDAIVLLFCCSDGAQHQGMCHFQCSCVRLEVIVDPAGEHGCFHRRGPRLWQRLHPVIQVHACGGKLSFGIDLATAVLHAVTDLSLGNIQSDVIHRFHGGASLVFSESASAEFSFFTPSAPPSTYTFKLTGT